MAARATPLPIDPLLPEITRTLKEARRLIVEAPPGAGKTTRIPAALLAAGFGESGEILVVQPRRLPARLAALRVAEELGEPLGQRVGYTVRFEEVASAATRLRFVTEGILTRRLLADPALGGVSAVILDEFHERHLASDLALALLVLLQRRRPELAVCVMSATLDADPVAEFLAPCPRVRSAGRQYDVDIEHLEAEDQRPVPVQVAGAVRRLSREGLDGDVLVFLSGAGEIRRSAIEVARLAETNDLLVLPLHGQLPPAEQDRAVRPADRRKIILSTNVAETSVTIDGIAAVVDSGQAQLASHSPWSGLSTLATGKISQAAAIQRAGRAGRTRAGRALRLFTRYDFESRRPFELPEVQRLDLAEPVLFLHALGIDTPAAFGWFEPPPVAALAAAEKLLARLSAIDGVGQVTEIGRAMLRFPVHPRLGRLIVEGEKRGVARKAALAAALIAERDILEGATLDFRRPTGASVGAALEDADLLHRLERFEAAQAADFQPSRLRGMGLDSRAVLTVDRSRRQLERLTRPGAPAPAAQRAVDEALGLCALAGFADRVMQRRASESPEVVLSGGGSAVIGSLPPERWLVGIDVESRGRSGQARGKSGGAPSVRLAVGIEPEWLLEVAGEGLEENRELRWDDKQGRVLEVRALRYGQLVLEDSTRPAPPSESASALLRSALLAQGFGGLFPEEEAGAFLGRYQIFRQAFAQEDKGEAWPEMDAAAVEQTLARAAQGHTSLAEVRALGWRQVLAGALPPNLWPRLEAEVPLRVRLPGGRAVPVNYPLGQPPWIESRLQDFFGMRMGPAICQGRIPLVLHLLAPNQRAVQVTRDLEGFWREHYPSLRRQLSRRYPKHAWPEDGATAAPPAPRPPRPR